MTNLLNLISFIVMSYGIFKVFDIEPLEISKKIQLILSKERKDIKYRLKKKKYHTKGIKGIIQETYTILDLMDKKEQTDYIWLSSIILFVLGALIAITINNIFLIPILAVGLGLMPFWYIFFIYISFKKRINDELETALSTITTSYIRTDNIISAIEENLEYIDRPVRNTFEFFLGQSRLVTSNTKLAIENMKTKINNDVFREWCDVLIASQDNRNLKHTLTPVVNKLSDTRIISAQLDTIIFEPLKDFFLMTIMLLANIPIIRMINKEWYEILTKTVPGKIVLSIMVLAIFITSNGVMKLSRPIEYKS